MLFMCLKMSHWGSPLLTWNDCQFQEWSMPAQMPPSQWEQSSITELEWRVNTCGGLTCDTKCWQARTNQEWLMWAKYGKFLSPQHFFPKVLISIGQTSYTGLERFLKKFNKAFNHLARGQNYINKQSTQKEMTKNI